MMHRVECDGDDCRCECRCHDRCRVTMRYTGGPCWRLTGHGGPHRSRDSMEAVRVSRAGSREDAMRAGTCLCGRSLPALGVAR